MPIQKPPSQCSRAPNSSNLEQSYLFASLWTGSWFERESAFRKPLALCPKLGSRVPEQELPPYTIRVLAHLAANSAEQPLSHQRRAVPRNPNDSKSSRTTLQSSSSRVGS